MVASAHESWIKTPQGLFIIFTSLVTLSALIVYVEQQLELPLKGGSAGSPPPEVPQKEPEPVPKPEPPKPHKEPWWLYNN